ncbi:site-specific integrase [Vibrio cholerae]|nr:site-specific integrase [Vibrio cholerae]
MTKSRSQAKTLTAHQVKKIFKRIELMSNPQQKAAIVALSLSGLRVSGLRVTELSLITVRDLVMNNGEVRTEIALRAAITKGCKPRQVWLSDRTRTILQKYIDYRIDNKQGTSLGSDYRGLNPKSCFVLSGKGYPYSLKAKHRTMTDGTVKTYFAAYSVELLLREVYIKCGLKGASSHSGRRSLASNMNKANVPLNTISRCLGHSQIETTLLYIEISPDQLSKAAEQAF